MKVALATGQANAYTLPSHARGDLGDIARKPVGFQGAGVRRLAEIEIYSRRLARAQGDRCRSEAGVLGEVGAVGLRGRGEKGVGSGVKSFEYVRSVVRGLGEAMGVLHEAGEDGDVEFGNVDGFIEDHHRTVPGRLDAEDASSNRRLSFKADEDFRGLAENDRGRDGPAKAAGDVARCAGIAKDYGHSEFGGSSGYLIELELAVTYRHHAHFLSIGERDSADSGATDLSDTVDFDAAHDAAVVGGEVEIDDDFSLVDHQGGTLEPATTSSLASYRKNGRDAYGAGRNAAKFIEALGVGLAPSDRHTESADSSDHDR